MALVKAPRSWPKKLTFEQSFWNGSAIDGDERFPGPRTIAVDGSGCQFLARPAFAFDQDRGILRANPGKKPVNLFHSRALPHHVVVQIHFQVEPQIFLFKPLQAARIVQRHSANACDCHRQLHVVVVETESGIIAFQINTANDLLKYVKGNAQKGIHLRTHQALDLAQTRGTFDIRGSNRKTLLHDLAQNRPAYAYWTRGILSAMARKNTAEFLTVPAIEQNRSALGGNEFKNQIQNLRLQLIQIADRVNQPADLEQRIQIPCHPRARQFLNYEIGLEITCVLQA